MDYANSIRNKIVIGLIIIGLIGAIRFLAMCSDDNKAMEEVLNETYKDYEANPDNYIKTTATIIEEYDADDGFEISFYGTNEWLVEIKLSDGKVMETNVMRDENDNIGDVVEVVYEKNDNYRYINASRTKYVECWTVAQSIDILDTIIKIGLVGMIGFAVFTFIKKRVN